MAENLVDRVAGLEAQALDLTEKARQDAKRLATEADEKLDTLRARHRDELEKVVKGLEGENQEKARAAIEDEKRAFEAGKQALDQSAQSLIPQLADKLTGEFFRVNDGD